MLTAVLSKAQLFFFFFFPPESGGRWGEGERIKQNCNKGFGAFGSQAADHILIPVAETER